MFLSILTSLLILISTSYANECIRMVNERFGVPESRPFFSSQGFRGRSPVVSPSASVEMSKLGFFEWNARLTVVESVEEARELAGKRSDHIWNSAFIITKKKEGVSKENFRDYFKFSDDTKVVWFESPYEDVVKGTPFDEIDYEMKELSFGEVKDYFETDKMELERSHRIIAISEEEATQRGLYTFFIPGLWSSPYVRGVMIYEEQAASSTVKKIKKTMRKKYDEGFRITLNQDVDEVLQKLATQVRKGQEEDDNAHSYKETREEVRARFKNGTLFTVEMRDPQGQLVAGALVPISGKFLSPESIFYDDINLGKMAMVAVSDISHSMGLPFMDIQMVSPVSKMLKGRYISRDEYYNMIDGIKTPEIKKVSGEWRPNLGEEKGSIVVEYK